MAFELAFEELKATESTELLTMLDNLKLNKAVSKSFLKWVLKKLKFEVNEAKMQEWLQRQTEDMAKRCSPRPGSKPTRWACKKGRQQAEEELRKRLEQE